MSFLPGTNEVDAPSQSPVRTVSLQCGYDVQMVTGDAVYTHCDPGTHVAIYIEHRNGLIAERCVGPGETVLGPTSLVSGAYYAGKLCDAL